MQILLSLCSDSSSLEDETSSSSDSDEEYFFFFPKLFPFAFLLFLLSLSSLFLGRVFSYNAFFSAASFFFSIVASRLLLFSAITSGDVSTCADCFLGVCFLAIGLGIGETSRRSFVGVGFSRKHGELVFMGGHYHGHVF